MVPERKSRRKNGWVRAGRGGQLRGGRSARKRADGHWTMSGFACEDAIPPSVASALQQMPGQRHGLSRFADPALGDPPKEQRTRLRP